MLKTNESYPLEKENPKDRGAWWATVHGLAKSQTRLRTHIHAHNESYDLAMPCTQVLITVLQQPET